MKFIIPKTTVSAVKNKISEFPERYQSHRSGSGEWKALRVPNADGKLIFQVVDTKFEPTKGNVTSEEPHLHIDIEQKENDVHVSCKLKWQKKIVLLIMGAVLLLLLGAAVGVMRSDSRFIFLSVGMIALICVWLIQHLVHDRKMLAVFSEWMRKDFPNVHIEK